VYTVLSTVLPAHPPGVFLIKTDQDAADWRLENEEENSTYWTSVIRPRSPWFHLDLHELWNYRDLILLFVRRDFVAQYKQTILGPLWFFLQPLFTTIVFTVVFGRIARIPTDGIPDFLFYLSGTVCWAYFAVCLTETSDTFFKNSQIFGKVFFPRLVVPVSIVISNILKFLVQFALFLVVLGFFVMGSGQVRPNFWILALPLLILQMGMLGLGCGIIVSAMTTKYRDLSLLVTFGVQLWMYATPVVYPLSQIPEKYRFYFSLNPMTAVVESFRRAFLGTSSIGAEQILLSWAITVVFLFLGIVLFSRVEKTFMDTV
jgi:lipopolysaccharide transport system permease protein